MATDERYRYRQKDRLVKIYSIDTTTINGVTTNVRSYPYSAVNKNGLHAFVQFQSAQQRLNNGIETSALTITVCIYYRPKIVIGQFIEYQGNTYQICLPPDEYKMNRRELKLTAVSTAPLEYSSERYIA